MRELFYRRDNKGGGGYKVVAREASISAKEEAFGSQKAMPVSVGEVPMFTYKMCCTEAGTVLVSCGYIDPHGSRGSGFTHALLTEDAAERSALLDAYPAASPYFGRVREAYSRGEDDNPLDLETKPLRVPLQEYLDGVNVDPRAAIGILRETFQSEELLKQVFAAILDSASANPRMVVIVLEGDKVEELPEHGRRIAEALYACLPEVIAARVGYQAPALNLSDVTFCLRFVNQAALAKSSVVYGVQPSQQRFTPPQGMRLVIGEYIEALARQVWSDDLGAFVWIRTMRRQLSDWSMFGSKNVPQDIALRYAFYTRPDALTPTEIRQLLDWRHEMIEQAARTANPALFDASSFWKDAEAWVTQKCLPEIWRSMDSWKRGDPVLDPELLRVIFRDSQQLYAMHRPEAGFYADYLAENLARGTMCPPQDAPKLRRELLGYFCDQANRAHSESFADQELYWNGIEAWVRREWCEGDLIMDSKAVEAVRKLYRFDANRMQPYVDAYVRLLIDKKTNLCNGDNSEFYHDAVKKLFNEHRDVFAASMQRELQGQNPFQSAQALQKYHWYQSRTEGDGSLTDSLRRLSDRQLQYALSSMTPQDAEALLDEVNGGRGKGIVPVAEQLLSKTDAIVAIQQRIVSLLSNSGFYEYYPEKLETSRQIAELLDQFQAFNRVSWTQRFETLERVRGMSMETVSGDDFDAFLRESDRSMDNKQRQKARDLLWSSIRKAYEGGKAPSDFAPLVRALAMKSYDAGTFSPSEMCEDCEKLNQPEAKLKRFCAKQANEKAEEGMGYLAAEVLKYLKTPAKKRAAVECRYPREPERQQARDHRGHKRKSGKQPAFAGVPFAVPVAGTVVFGGGLAASAVMLLRMVGLM